MSELNEPDTLTPTHYAAGMDVPYPVEFERAIQALNEADVSYVVVGGVAVVLHGVDRLTADLDVVVDLRSAPCRRALEALTAIGYRPRAPVEVLEFANEARRREWIVSKAMRVFSLWDPSGNLPVLDLFAEYPLDFDRLVSGAIQMDLDGVTAPVVCVDDLLELKKLSGRAKDLEDIAALHEHRR